MSLTIVLNTCALGPKARETSNSQGRLKHAQREYALRTWILPAYIANPFVKELIVVGEWEPPQHDEYSYVHVPSTYLTCVDALAQRQAGFEASTGEVLVFQHDDHILDSASILQFNCGWPPHFSSAEVLVPSRWTRLRFPLGERLNNGEPQLIIDKHAGQIGESEEYVSGHCAVYQRDAIVAASWRDVPKRHTWDQEHTRQLVAAGVRIRWEPVLRCEDVEMGSTPWL